MSKKVLIVDDDKAIRVLLAKLLHNEYHVETAKSGEEALEIAPRFQSRFDEFVGIQDQLCATDPVTVGAMSFSEQSQVAFK